LRSSLASDPQSSDAIDDELFPIFVEEAIELLAELAEQLRLWEAHPEELSGGVGALRALHTFKGGARLAGAMRLGEVAHRLETSIEQMMAHGVVSAALLAAVHQSADDLSEDFERLRSAPFDARQVEPLQPLLEEAQEARPESASSMGFPELGAQVGASQTLDATEATLAPSLAERIEEVMAPGVTADTPEPLKVARVDWGRWVQRESQSAEDVSQPFADSPTAGSVRVRALTLDRMVGQAGEVGVARARMESDSEQMQQGLRELTDNLERLRRQLRDLELQAESQMASRIEAARTSQQAFDPLEMDRFTRVQELTRMMAESVSDVGTVQRGLQQTLQSTSDQLSAQARLNRDLQDDLLKARMIEFDTLSDRLYRVVRQAAKESAKQVRLNVEGGGIELDRSVLDRISPPLEHLLRNAVVHGIESANKRSARGKPLAGTIDVALRQTGNEVQIEVRDDGGGLDLLRIADRARAMGLLAQDASATDAELAAFIFHPGMSTADQVSELAGRGIGMEVVRSEVTAMGGRIETSSSYAQGTAFRMLLPLTTAVTQVVILEAGRQIVAVPSTLVEVVRRVPAAQVGLAYETGRLTHGGEEIPFFWLGSLLQESLRGSLEGRNLPIVVVRSAAQRVAVHVSQVVGNQEAVVKNLGPQLARLPGLTGMTVLSSGQAVLIYNPVALAAVYGNGVRQRFLLAEQDQPQAMAEVEPEVVVKAPLVMVVDDSLTVRRVTQRLLLREGYRVALAKDGLDALELVADEVPAVMLCDIEMPRMDGFDVVRNLRAEPKWAELPVIMITSRIASKHREHALQLGVDHYLGKPYDEDELLSLVKGFVAARALA
jgi:chemosensory pili system protein ChpA (sensor histidine kinase/response regulator)